MASFLERRFHLAEYGTTPRTEVLAGVTTFLTLAYILFVQPALLSSVGLDFGAVFVATCVASAFATLLMALLANYPIAVAPAMGHNFYFTFTVVVAMEVPWEVALGGVAVAGLLFVATAGFGLREKLITAIPGSLKHAIAAGIGLLIAMIGLQWAGVIVASPATLVTLGDLSAPPVLVALVGLVVMAVLWARAVRGAILLGILTSTLAAWFGGLVQFQGVASLPPSLLPTLGRFDILGALRPEMVAVIFVFFFLALFDSVGTLVAVGEQAGLMRDGTLPRARGALLADAVGTVVGAGLGTSTVTAFVESATGVAAGGRTGLTAVVIALLFLLRPPAASCRDAVAAPARCSRARTVPSPRAETRRRGRSFASPRDRPVRARPLGGSARAAPPRPADRQASEARGRCHARATRQGASGRSG